MARRKQGSKDSRRSSRPSRDDAGPRKRSRHLEGVTDININNPDFLQNFVTEHGKIIPARLTGANAKQQRRIKQGVRRARNIQLLP